MKLCITKIYAYLLQMNTQNCFYQNQKIADRCEPNEESKSEPNPGKTLQIEVKHCQNDFKSYFYPKSHIQRDQTRL